MKIYKQNNKLVIYLPIEVVSGLSLKDGDEVDFFKYGEKSFIFSKKSDITNLIVNMAGQRPQMESEFARSETKPERQAQRPELSQDEISVLKKLDTLRYSNRTPDNVNKMLNSSERMVLQQLVKKRAVTVFKNQKSNTNVYSIPPTIYDRFLMRKKSGESQQNEMQKNMTYRNLAYGPGDAQNNDNLKKLQENGFVVLPTEAEAASLSLVLEDSVKSGYIVGTRAFNKKFYIVLRGFFNKHSDKIIKELRDGEKSADEVAKTLGIDEEGARAILYLMAESGDVTEKKRDIFALA